MDKENTSIFLQACRREPTPSTPIWFMRQAGRYLAEYRSLRERHSLLELCKNPNLATEVTLMPVEKFGFDAAILFADIMLPLEPMGIAFEYKEGEGPIISRPLRSHDDVMSLQPVEPEQDLSFVIQAVQMIRQELQEWVSLIGFAGAPFTLASYLIEGGPSRRFVKTKALMYNNAETWHLLMDVLAKVTLAYLQAQIRAGAQAVQLFDSWVGCLSPDDYQQFIFPYSERILQGLKEIGAPTIHFGTGTATLLESMKEAGGDVIGVDWRIPLDVAWDRLGHEVGIQGNLEPAVLLGPWERIRKKTLDILRRADGRPGHIFNLGHGILPETSPDHVKALVELVHEESQQ